ncbi:hypothetical protein N8342_06295 [Acidimicrobiales bacterium]|jgi:hypothetical protein|nr:hypothetical protein [Acidimicrobiaceae bacterium]MBT6445790.1 hypothetical protein [Acidimicrobiaceae bacterium]MDC1389438.1 hypothetical protein [Acidimicrobiales bacterium]
MKRRAFLMSTLLFIVLAVAACGGDPEPSPIPVDVDGFPIDWPIAIPPGTVNGCDNGTVMQENSFFSVVMCLPDDPDPFTASENYLATLEGNGFVEREPGAFITTQETFLDGNGIEIYFQLVGDEATVVLIKPA